MKKILFFLFLSLFSYSVMAQSTGPTKKCPTCGLSIAKCEYRGKHPMTGTENGHVWVDLGLPSGTKWATMNVGANSLEESGDFFAWGETSMKNDYGWENQKYWIDDSVKFSKYVTNSQYGNKDGKKDLDLEDDAAYVNWGKGWRMPSDSQVKELRSNCTHVWTTLNGIDGYKLTSKNNGNSIFLPATGYWTNRLRDVGSSGSYWSRSLCTSDCDYAYCIEFYSDSYSWHYRTREYGFSVRPVSE